MEKERQMELKGRVTKKELVQTRLGAEEAIMVSFAFESKLVAAMTLQRPWEENDLWPIGMPVTVTVTRGEPDA